MTVTFLHNETINEMKSLRKYGVFVKIAEISELFYLNSKNIRASHKNSHSRISIILLLFPDHFLNTCLGDIWLKHEEFMFNKNIIFILALQKWCFFFYFAIMYI